MRIAIMCATPGVGLCPYPVELAIHFKEQGHEIHAFCGSDRELRCVRQSRIPECSLPVHFNICHKPIPVRNRTPASPRMKIDARQSECRRNQRGG